MVDAVQPGSPIAPPQPAPKPVQEKEYFYPDGSAVPDAVVYHRQLERIYDDTDQDVPDEENSQFFGQDGLAFSDFLDVINPLQHIPVVSTIYRAITGDEISPGARVAGGALFGGPIGLGVAIVNAAVEASSGQDIGETIMTALTGDDAIETASSESGKPAGIASAGSTDIAAAVTDSEPEILAVPPQTTTQRLQAPALPGNAPSPQKQQTAQGPVAIPSGLPYGGMGTMALGTGAENQNDPVAALLQARTVVPAGGPVPGLGRAPLAKVERIPDLPVVGTRLADKLAALAAQSKAPDETQTARDRRSDKQAEADRTVTQPPPAQVVPNALVPETMLNALDRYRQFKRAEIGKAPG